MRRKLARLTLSLGLVAALGTAAATSLAQDLYDDAPAPKPAAQPAPKPVAQPAPKPAAQPAPKPVAQPAPAPKPAPAPTPRVVAEPTPAREPIRMAPPPERPRVEPPPGLPPNHPSINRRPMQPRAVQPPRVQREVPKAPAAIVEAPAEHGAAHGGHCPGHGPTDAPPPPNLYQGLLGVDNDLAVNGNFVQKLLFRYENPKNECDPKNQAPPYLAQLINFTILALIIGKFGKKPLVEGLAKRRASIMGEIDTATRLKKQAEGRLNKLEEDFDSIEDRLEAARVEYAAMAEQERTRILTDAEERRVRMRKDAEFRIEQELKSGKILLLKESADNAVRAAEELLKARLSARDHDAVAEDYLASLATALGVQGQAVKHARDTANIGDGA